MPPPADKIRNSSAIAVRRMNASDVPAADSILMESPEASRWSKEILFESASQGVAWVAEMTGMIAGILIGRVVADEFEILNLAVGKEFRRHGVATQLVSAALEYAQSAGAPHTFLEVRASNGAGKALYKRMGFRICGRRSNYYHNPTEDAVLLDLHEKETRE